MEEIDKNDYEVRAVPNKDTYDFLLNIHYAKRIPSISYAFGLYKSEELVGIITYGTPASSALRRGIAGESNITKVLELNRLCLKYNKKNEASLLVSRSLKMLPKPKIIVSYADTEQGHEGIVYQACSFYYSGLSAKRTDWKVRGMEHLHGMTIADQFRGVPNRAKAIREHYGDAFYLKERSRKHRYIYLIGTKKEVKKLKSELKYRLIPYAKK